MCFYSPLFSSIRNLFVFFGVCSAPVAPLRQAQRKVLHLYWLQAPILDASPPQALGEQPLGMPVAFLKNRRSGYGEAPGGCMIVYPCSPLGVATMMDGAYMFLRVREQCHQTLGYRKKKPFRAEGLYIYAVTCRPPRGGGRRGRRGSGSRRGRCSGWVSRGGRPRGGRWPSG